MLLLADRTGQLGNRLVRHGHLIAFCEEHGLRMANLGMSDYRNGFPALEADPLCRYPLKTSRLGTRGANTARRAIARLSSVPGVERVAVAGGERLDLSRADVVERMTGARVVILEGFLLRDWGSFVRHADTVRRVLRPDERYLEVAADTVAGARRDGGAVVGVHMRRGDYRDWNDGRYLFSDAEYAAVMDAVAARLAGRAVSFVVASDEPLGSEITARNDVSAAPGSPMADMFTLAACDAIVGPPSTFSGWGSYYGGVPLHWIEDPAAVPGLDEFEVFGVPQARER